MTSNSRHDHWKGIILAGGLGTRLHPITLACCKQLLPVYNKPMIYYPLTSLMLGGIREILIISTPRDLPRFEDLLGDGSQLGLSLSYAEQLEPRGIADAFILGRDFIADSPVCLILGDNLFYGEIPFLRTALARSAGATIFAYAVSDPQRYGILGFDAKGRPDSIEEKPKEPRSNAAVTGLYCYDNQVVELAAQLSASDRGELEITDINRHYLDAKELHVEMLDDGVTWLDTGTPESLLEAASFVSTIEHRQGKLVGSPEAAAFKMDFVDSEQLTRLATAMGTSELGSYLAALAKGSHS